MAPKSHYLAAILVSFTMITQSQAEAAESIDLWANGNLDASNVEESELEVGLLKQTVTQNVVRPTLIPYLVDQEINTGVSVIVAPGGGFKFLSMKYEGHEVAKWLNGKGINAFVLKYRVEQTPTTSGAFTRHLLWSLVKGWWSRTDEYGGLPKSPAEPLAIQDGMQAVRLVRENAEAWHLNPNAVGLLGFSAGAAVALGTALEAEAGARPDFVASIYGAKAVQNIPDNAPPLFVMATMDDPLIPNAWAEITYQRWQAATNNAQLLYYPEGGHGFGVRIQDKASDEWINDFYRWLRGLYRLP